MLHFLEENKDITPFSAYKTHATTRYLFRVKNVEDVSKIASIMDYAKEQNLPVLFLGSGTNCLFAFDEYPGIVVHNELKGYSITETDHQTILEVASGELVHPLVTTLFDKYTISTLVLWAGLPGTIGGAVIGNAGCFKLETRDILIDAEVYFPAQNQICTIKNEEFEFVYRSSKFKNTTKAFVISARFDITKTFPDNEYTRDFTPETLRELRRSKQPAGISCGSFFKNPVGTSAGALIDQVGLKGTKIGSVMISEQHGNFFTALPSVDFRDILALRDLAKKTVFEKTRIMLEEEVKIITL